MQTASIHNKPQTKPVQTPPIKDFEGETQLKVAGSKPVCLSDFDKYRITKEKNIPETPAVITIGSAKVAAPGNITPVTAEAKAGKTAFTSAIIAGAISKDGEIDGLDEVYVMPNPEGKAVIRIDTEQSESDQQYNLNTVLKRANLTVTPDNYLEYNSRVFTLAQLRDFTEKTCLLANEQFNGIHLIVIDGAADFITSVNDEAEANAIILFFIQLAVEYACPVILVVHLNENAGKNGDTMPRGHVGRQAVRKGYAQLNIIKDGDASVLQTLRARKAGSLDTPLVAFKYNHDKGYHSSINAEAVKEFKEVKKDSLMKGKLQKLAEKVFPASGSLTHKEAVDKIRKLTSKSEPTAKRTLKDMTVFDMVTGGEGEPYRLKMPGLEIGITRYHPVSNDT